MRDHFDDLIAQADAAPVEGWDFSWLAGRATEQRPPWKYQRLIAQRLSQASAGLDIQTGGGEVLAGIQQYGHFPPTMVATETWPPNAIRATQLLHPLGVVVVTMPEHPPLPFSEQAFDIVISRHPNEIWWDEISRVLIPGGTYLAQQIGPASLIELAEYFLGPNPHKGYFYAPDYQAGQARQAGLDIIQMRTSRLRTEFFDIGAVVYFLRKVIWTVPGFTTEQYRDKLYQLHQHILCYGSFVSYATRVLVEAQKPLYPLSTTL